MDRIAVVGCIGAGKSTLARTLGAAFGLEVVHLDRLWWHDGSYAITGRRTVAEHTVPPAEFRELQRELAAEPRWVIDGVVDSLDVRLERADAVIFLDLPPQVCAWRVIRRTGTRRDDYPPDVRETWRWALLLIRWVLVTYPRHRRPRIEQLIADHAPDARVIRLRSRGAVAAFVDGLPVHRS